VRSGSTTWSNSGSTSICALVAQTRSSPPFALDRLREHDPQHLLYECTKPCLGRTGPLRLTPLEPLDRLAALIFPPHVHRHRYPRVLTRTAAHRRFPRRPGAAAHGRELLSEPSPHTRHRGRPPRHGGWRGRCCRHPRRYRPTLPDGFPGRLPTVRSRYWPMECGRSIGANSGWAVRARFDSPDMGQP
jgi:hypothetical protein